MHEPTHAPGWRGRPTSYVELRSDDDRQSPFVIFSYFGCAIGAAASLAAAAIAWAPAIAAWIWPL